MMMMLQQRGKERNSGACSLWLHRHCHHQSWPFQHQYVILAYPRVADSRASETFVRVGRFNDAHHATIVLLLLSSASYFVVGAVPSILGIT
jgi:hypothetical protein